LALLAEFPFGGVLEIVGEVVLGRINVHDGAADNGLCTAMGSMLAANIRTSSMPMEGVAVMKKQQVKKKKGSEIKR
jgi:hypothetical protein